ncbi:MAG: TonB-dependent receptor [Tenacibaculum sp.]
MKYLVKLLSIFAILSYSFSVGQTIKGKLVNKKNEPLSFIDVVEKGTANGVNTNENGEFSIKLKQFPSILIFSSLGYRTVEKKVSSATAVVNIVMEEQSGVLDEVVLTGSRAKPRTILDSPVPIDNVSLSDLQATGQNSIDQMLSYTVPSYNATNQSISDATAHFDPADLRGLGPSRTLVMVNGKRKNQSALVYINDTPGKGEVGTDMKSIPAIAIERVEILRDGASAQYGSDAVAGVVNIILKKQSDFTQINLNSGISSRGDGFTFDADANHTFGFNSGGFINASLGLSYQDYTNRAGTPQGDSLFGISGENGEKPVESADGFLATATEVATGLDILQGSTDWQRENPGLGAVVGQPEMKKINVFINTEHPLGEKAKLYAFGGYNIREGKSFAVYRVPYWPDVPGQNSPKDNPLYNGNGSYQGFQPTFEIDITDLLFTTGTEFKLGGFNADISANYGENKIDYTIGNTINTSLGADSPTKFKAGGYVFSNIIGNFDISKNFEKLSVGLGAEARQERFKVIAGQEASYVGGGAQSFPGLQPSNELNETRTNIGAYGTLDLDLSDNFLIGGAARYENYSDFGNNITWKVNSRYKLGQAGVLRASYSTGFRAPSLHQVYFSNIQTLVSGGTISNQGTFNNTNSTVKNLGVAPLFAETSNNVSAGLTVKASDNFTISFDYYYVKVNDRVLFTGEINAKDDNDVENASIKKILDDNQITSLKFFINAVNTNTQGFDYTMRYKNINVASGNLDFHLAVNVNNTRLDGEVKTPEELTGYKSKIFNRKEQSRIISARPNTKLILGTNYKIRNFKAYISNTYFGQVIWQHASDPEKDQTFRGKMVTDLSLDYDFNEIISLKAQVNNLFDVFPDEVKAKGDPATNLGGRFRYPWEVNQFGISGTVFKAGLKLQF